MSKSKIKFFKVKQIQFFEVKQTEKSRAGIVCSWLSQLKREAMKEWRADQKSELLSLKERAEKSDAELLSVGANPDKEECLSLYEAGEDCVSALRGWLYKELTFAELAVARAEFFR